MLNCGIMNKNMAKEKTYYDYLFTKSEEEEQIQAELDAERERYENTEEYKEHAKRLDDILDRLIEAGQRRRKEAEKYKPARRRTAPKKIDMEAFKAEQEEKRKKEFESYPEELKTAINAYNALDENEKRKFASDTFVRHWTDYDDYENPQTTKEDLSELLEILVQTSIDFIRERGLKDIDAIGFSADSLQESSRWGEWTPATDASVYVTGLGVEKGKDGKEYTVVKKIGEYM